MSELNIKSNTKKHYNKKIYLNYQIEDSIDFPYITILLIILILIILFDWELKAKLFK